MDSSPYALRVLHECRVSPPKGSVPDASLPLTSFDVTLLHASPVERLFFYPFPHPADHFLHSALPALKASLSLTLQRFYPLAGRLRRYHTANHDLEIHYADGDSVPLTVLECAGADFHELAGDQPRPYSKLKHLVPTVLWTDDSMPLLAVQATVFPSSGVVLAVTILHVACDGSSFIHFVRSWAAACRSGEPLEPPPFYDRTVAAAVSPASVKELPGPKTNVRVVQDDAVLASFVLSPKHIARLKELVLAKATRSHCSAFVVACAYTWTCLARARGCASNESIYFVIVVNCRERLQPPLPQAYFGNCARLCFMTMDAADVAGANGLVRASEAIGGGIDRFGRDGCLESTEADLSKLHALPPRQRVLTMGSPRLRSYDTDFGWGRPVKVEMASAFKVPSAISLTESREEQGGIQIGVALSKPEMDAFSSIFSSGIELLLENGVVA